MAYRGQFERLIRAEERGRPITSTRTIAVFDDGLVVCAVGVYGDARPSRGIFGSLRRTRRPVRRDSGPARGDEHIRAGAEASGSGVTFAETWPGAQLIPLAVIDRIVVTRPRQVSELAVYVEAAGGASPERLAYLGDLSAERVREALGSSLGERLHIEVQEQADGTS
jgi:hypothetical protein